MPSAKPFLESFSEARRAYERAWSDPKNTRFELPPVDVNKVLRERYRTMPQRPLSNADIWDMESKKSWDPKSYIPYVVSEGRSWGRQELPDGYRFCRASTQLGWITAEREPVLEDVYISDAEQGIFFLGRETLADEDGRELRAGTHQPVFHVWHGVGGSRDNPTNLWSIVLLTERNDPRYEEPFKEMERAGWLPGFIEIYIRSDLGMTLERQTA